MSNSYKTIFKSSALIGGVQVITILLGIARTKGIAILLGPVGVGLISLYTSATELIGTVTGLGIGSSGVRQIAEAVGENSEERISSTVLALRRTSLISGLFGLIVVLAISAPLSHLTFGDSQPVWGMALMSLTLLFNTVSAGQLALLKGLRQLRKLAACQVLGALFSTLVAILIIYILRLRGVTLFLVALSAFTLFTSWIFARRVKTPNIFVSSEDVLRESRSLLGMGAAFMLSALFAAASAYITRILILRILGDASVGLYQATWTLSTLYVGFILNAMLTDFYPRLTSLAKDDFAVNSLVNQQTEMGLLIAVPGVLATITLAPLILTVFYSKDFLPATQVIRWQSLGIGLRMISWPMGFIQLAKGKGRLFVLTELAGSLIFILFAFFGIRLFGLEGVGVAFVLTYLSSILIALMVSRSLSGFIWSTHSKQIIKFSAIAIGALLAAVIYLPQTIGIIVGLFFTLLSAAGSVYFLQKLLGVSIWSQLFGRGRAMPD